ncbi:MFS transporter [Phaeobacter sp. NW0010-22]
MKETALNEHQNKAAFALSGPSLSLMLAALGTSTAAVTLPEVSRDFQGGRFDATLVVSTYVFATTALIVPAGRAGDLFGKRTVLVVGLCLYLLGAIFAYFAPTLPILVASRVVQGAGAAAMMAMPLALVRDFALPGQVGRWMGLMGTMSAIGTASGPALGGVVAAVFGWRAVYFFQIPLTLAAFILCLVYLKNNKRADRRTSIDLPGAGALALFLAAVTLLVSDVAKGIDATTAGLVVVAVGAFAGFLLIESRAQFPIIPPELLRSIDMRFSLAMNATISLIMMGILIVGPFYLTRGLGLTTAQMGLVMSVGPISSALSGIPAGRLTERAGPSNAVLLGAFAMMVSTAAMAGLPYVFGLGGFIVAFILLAPSYQLFLAALNTFVMENVPEHERGVTSGVLNLSRNFGFILGAGVLSAAFWSLAHYKTGTGIEAYGISFAMAGTFAMCCVLTLGVVLLAFALGRTRFQTSSS